MQCHAEMTLLPLLRGEREILARVVAGDAADDFAEDVIVLREAAILHPFAQQTAQDAAEILVARIGQEGAAVGQHADKARQIAKIRKARQLVGHAGEMVVEPPRRAVLHLADRFGRLEAAAQRVNRLIVRRIQGVEDRAGQPRRRLDHPKDFKGHSLSVSDVVVLHQDGQDAAHYVDSAGFRQVPEFLQEQKQLTPDDLETGETVKTPRGTFHVTAMSREQIEAAGYGFHHQSDDGKYLIMGNGTRAFAVAAEQPEKENPLKYVEDTVEQNDNNFDGIINNTPTVDELEAKVKAGETISLVDLANAVKADRERGKEAKPEKKPSIRAQLRADKEKAQKKNAKQKSQDLERS